MEMCQLQDQHRKLSALAGKWVGEETINPSPWDPKGGPALGKIEARVGLGGFFVISDYVQERGGKVSYEGHGTYGWSTKEQCYMMYWFDSVGGANCNVAPARGSWEGTTLTFSQQSEQGHARYIYNFEGEGRYTFRIEHSADGKQWGCFMEGRYTRK